MAENEKKTELEKTADQKPAKKVTSDKPSAWDRVKTWFRSIKSECKKIAWASPKTVKTNSVIVLVAIVVFSIALAILDYCFSGAIVGLSRLI